MKQNTRNTQIYTQEGAPAKHINPLQQLRRTVMACLLWENNFYESGESVADRIKTLVAQNKPEDVSNLAIEARTDFKLRHAPLLLAREMARNFKGRIVGDTIYSVIQRADELAEFLAIYWKDGKQPLSAQVKKGLARAWSKFDEYSLAKYDRDGIVKLRDSLFMCHARPANKAKQDIFKRLIDGNLRTPDTWEVGLSAGGDKKETFERLLSENKLGYMALLRNLRNMQEAGVDTSLIFPRLIEGARKSKALPFRYISAAQAVPAWEREIDEAMQLALESQEPLKGMTIILVDVSASMDWAMSSKSQLNRIDSACALAILIAGIAEQYAVFTFSHRVVQVPPRKGMALRDAIHGSQPRGGTYLGSAVSEMNELDYDRLIVITDEQSHDRVPDPRGTGYVINVASNENGVGYYAWKHIDGFSESVVRWVQETERTVTPV